MNIDNVINVLKQKYKYNDRLLNTLKTIMESMITYYGEEYIDRIYKTFIDVPIVFIKNPSEIKLSLQNVGVDMDINLPIIASGGYVSDFELVDDKVVHKEAIIIDIGKDVDNQLSQYETVVHEYCHAFMSNGTYERVGNKVLSSTGLLREETELGNSNTTMSNVQIEEGMNDYDAIEISRLKYPEAEGSKVYALNVDYVSILLDNKEIRKKVNASRINGDDSWKEILGVDLSNEYLCALDRYYKIFFDSSLSREERKELKAKERENLERVLKAVDNSLNTIDFSNSPKMAS